jgi:hypothetical protein
MRAMKCFPVAGQRSLETSMKKASRVLHDHAGRAAIRMAVGQPETGHRVSVAGKRGGREGQSAGSAGYRELC